MGTFKDAQTYIGYTFIGIYTIEMLVKWVGLTVRGYFKDTWNIFDFVLVVVAYAEILIVDVATSGGSLPIQPTLIRMLRLLRVVRVTRLPSPSPPHPLTPSPPHPPHRLTASSPSPSRR